MQATFQTLLGTAVLGLALFSQSLPVGAGESAIHEVTIGSPSNPWSAIGSMVGARYSNDSTQYIGCSVFFNPYGFESSALTCTAQDRTGKTFICYSFDGWNYHSEPRFVAVGRAMTNASRIAFESDGSGPCTSLWIENHSSNLP